MKKNQIKVVYYVPRGAKSFVQHLLTQGSHGVITTDHPTSSYGVPVLIDEETQEPVDHAEKIYRRNDDGTIGEVLQAAPGLVYNTLQNLA